MKIYVSKTKTQSIRMKIPIRRLLRSFYILTQYYITKLMFPFLIDNDESHS